MQEINLYCNRILNLVQSLSKCSDIPRDYAEHNTYIPIESATCNIIVTFYLIFVCKESCLLKIL